MSTANNNSECTIKIVDTKFLSNNVLEIKLSDLLAASSVTKNALADFDVSISWNNDLLIVESKGNANIEICGVINAQSISIESCGAVSIKEAQINCEDIHFKSGVINIESSVIKSSECIVSDESATIYTKQSTINAESLMLDGSSDFETTLIEADECDISGITKASKCTINASSYQQGSSACYIDSVVCAEKEIKLKKDTNSKNSDFIAKGNLAVDDVINIVGGTLKAKNYIQNTGALNADQTKLSFENRFYAGKDAKCKLENSEMVCKIFESESVTNLVKTKLNTENSSVLKNMHLDRSEWTNSGVLFTAAHAEIEASNETLIVSDVIDVRGKIAARNNSRLESKKDFNSKLNSKIVISSGSILDANSLNADGIIIAEGVDSKINSKIINLDLGEINLTKSNLESTDLNIKSSGKLVASSSNINAEVCKLEGNCSLYEDCHLNVKSSIDTNYLSNILVSYSEVTAKNISHLGNMSVDNANVKVVEKFSSNRAAKITGHSVKLQAETVVLDLDVKLNDLLHITADNVDVDYNVQAKTIKFNADKQLNINSCVMAEDTTIDSDHFFCGLDGSITGKSLNVTSLTTGIAPGGYFNVTNLSAQSFGFYSMGIVAAYNSNIQSVVSADLGLNIPSVPDNLNDVITMQKAESVATVLLSAASAPLAAAFNVGMKAYSLSQSSTKLYNDLNKKYHNQDGDNRLRHCLPTLLASKSLAYSASGLVGEGASLFKGLASDLGSVLTGVDVDSKDLLADIAAMIAPSSTSESGLQLNGGIKASYTVNDSSFAGVDSGVFVGQNVRSSAYLNANFGVKEAANLSLDYSQHYNAGKETASQKLNANINHLHVAEEGSMSSTGKTAVKVNGDLTNKGSLDLHNGHVEVAGKFEQAKDTNAENIAIKADKFNNTGAIKNSGMLDITAKHVQSSADSTITGADGSSCAVHSDTANMLGKEDHYSSVVDVKSMSNEEINDRVNKTGKHSNKHVRHSLDLKTESSEKLELNSSGLDRNVNLGIQTAGDIECATQFNGQALSLKTTNGNIDVLKDINTVGDTVLEASGNINKSKTAVKSENSNVVLNAGGIVDNSNGGTISAKEGTASVTGSTVNNNCGALGERSTIEAKLTFVEATDGNLENIGSTIKGSEFVSAVATGDINNTAQELKKFHGENAYTFYQAAQISGGAGNSETADVGAYVHANGKVNNIASEIGGAGRTIISGDQGVNMETKSNAYNDYDYKEKRGAVNKTYHKGQATEYGIATATGSKVDIISSEGGVTLHGAESIADDGTYIYAKKDVVLESHVSKEMHYKTEVKVKGLSRKKIEETTPTEKLNVIATNTGKMHVKSEEGQVIGAGNQFLGGGEVSLLVEGKKGVELTRRVLNHRVVEKSRKVSINIAGQSLINNSKKSKMERLAAASPLINSADSLLRSNNPLELAANTNNAVRDGLHLLDQIASENGVATAMKEHISAGVAVTKSKGITDYDIEGGGGSEGCSNVKFVAQEENVKIGNGYNGINKLEVEATKFIVANSELHSSTKYSEVTAAASVDATESQNYSASKEKSSSTATTQTQAVLTVKNAVLKVVEVELDGAIFTTNTASGYTDKIITRDKLNHEESKSDSQSVDANSNVSLSNVKSESQTIGAIGRLHVVDGINPEDFKVKEHENYGSIGITTDNPATNKLFESGTVKQTQHDLHEFSRRSGGSIGFNAAQVKNPSKTGINGVFGIDHKNYQARVGENGRQINKNQKTDAKVRFKVPKEAFAKNTEAKEPEAKNPAPMIFSSSANNAENSSDPKSVNAPEYLSASAKPYESTEHVQLERVINEPWKFDNKPAVPKVNKKQKAHDNFNTTNTKTDKIVVPKANQPKTEHPITEDGRFSLPSMLPASSDNPILAYAYAVGRGIEKGRDGVTDALLHPVNTAKSAATTVWDGLNAISEVAFDTATDGARQRNSARGKNVVDGIESFKNADGVQRTEVVSELLTSTILSTAVGGAVSKYASKQVPGNALNSNVQRLTNVIEDYLGKDFRMIKNKSGDPVFINADNSRRIRFDSKNPHGDVPHGHVEHYDKIAGDWIDYTDKHRIYLRDAMEYLNKPKMGKE